MPCICACQNLSPEWRNECCATLITPWSAASHRQPCTTNAAWDVSCCQALRIRFMPDPYCPPGPISMDPAASSACANYSVGPGGASTPYRGQPLPASVNAGRRARARRSAARGTATERTGDGAAWWLRSLRPEQIQHLRRALGVRRSARPGYPGATTVTVNEPVAVLP